jgi:hypothetical protein
MILIHLGIGGMTEGVIEADVGIDPCTEFPSPCIVCSDSWQYWWKVWRLMFQVLTFAVSTVHKIEDANKFSSVGPSAVFALK